MKKTKLLALAAVANGLLLGQIGAVEAKAKASPKDAQIEALTKRLELLEKRLEESEKRNTQLATKPPEVESPVVKQLDRKVKIIERKLEVDKEVADAAKKTSPRLEAGADGVRFVSPEGDHVVRLRGALQTDGKFYMDDNHAVVGGEANGINIPDRFELKQARVWLEGTLFKHFDFKIMPDFGKNGGTLLQDAYLDAHYFPYASLNIGKQKTPLSLERLQGDSDGTFLERAYPTQLASNRDVGVMLHGSFAKPGYDVTYGGPVDFRNFISYQLGVFNGSGDNGAASNLSDSSKQDDKEFVGRIWAHPFQHSGIEALEGLGVGVAGSWEQPNHKGTLNNISSANGGNTIVNYGALGGATGANTKTTSLVADGDHYRIYPQAYWYSGPFGLMAEYAISSQELLGGKSNGSNGAAGDTARIQQDNRAWQVLFSYVLTGEDNTFQGVKPREAFDPLNGKWGALQLAARWTELEIDKDSFKTQTVNGRPFQLLDPSRSIRNATAWSLGANWYLNKFTLIRADYEQTYFDGGAGTLAHVKDRPNEKVFSTRFQLSF
ncbi:OprO/OprP family phosphate-selective porin [Methylococcus sp. EFPC2]|uniref:OprO/OprP family phosphate-selective porin n=1 Tax=Methylococcus sp. EFPC2 TaxID=2812648 RepID=UPI0019689165|nr:porin [Methylococcus sp. EFPC2]QSA96885.1 hypothetical protein JWZ97_17030 [Methylococcus sp. EFPC2]